MTVTTVRTLLTLREEDVLVAAVVDLGVCITVLFCLWLIKVGLFKTAVSMMTVILSVAITVLFVEKLPTYLESGLNASSHLVYAFIVFVGFFHGIVAFSLFTAYFLSLHIGFFVIAVRAETGLGAAFYLGSLGVIRASARNMLKAIESALPELAKIYGRLSDEEATLFFRLLHRSMEKMPALSSREQREHRKLIASQLEEAGIAGAGELAEMLVEMRIIMDLNPILSLLSEEKAFDLVVLAYNLSSQTRNCDSILISVDKASKAVFALKAYSSHDRSGVRHKASPVDGIATAITLYYNQIKQGVEVVTKGLDNLPAIHCYPDELNQVWA